MTRPAEAGRLARPPARPLLASAAALAIGAAHALSFAPIGTWWAHLAALSAFALLLRRTGAADEARRTRRGVRAALPGFAFGMGWFVVGVGWLYISMHVYGLMPGALAALAVVVFAAYLSVFPAAAAWLCARADGGGPVRFAFAFASALTLAEFARGYWFTGFPWLSIGYPHVDGPLGGFAPVVGVYGVGWLAALCAGLVGASIAGDGAPSGMRARIGPLVGLALVFAAGGALGLVDWSRPHGEPIAVRLVQGNVPQSMKFDPSRTLSAMQAYVEQIEASERLASRPSLVLLPETAWTQPWAATPPALARRIEDFVARTGTAVAIGMPQVREVAPAHGAPARVVTNSVLLLSPASGGARVETRQYDKHHLVPFGEFVPWGFRWFVDLMRIPLGDFDRGALGQPPFEIAGQRIAPNICYEDTYGEELIPALQGGDGATILANVSNIAWFGDSHAVGQHLQIARMRSLELARPTIRATNTGSTVVIDHRGIVRSALAPFTRGVLDATVAGRTGLTPYAGTGNWPALALALAGLAAASGFGRRGPAS
ncbi:MAG: apolipoprotein N-acyltransferase [Lautropia sp.]